MIRKSKHKNEDLMKENARLEAELFACRETISKHNKPVARSGSLSGLRKKLKIVKISRSSANLSDNTSLMSKTKSKTSPLSKKILAGAKIPMLRPPKGKGKVLSEQTEISSDVKENVISINTNLKTVHLQNSLDSDNHRSPKSVSQRFMNTGVQVHY
jgi:hypothetical protein